MTPLNPCCWGYEGCDCGLPSEATPGTFFHGECHDCHCCRADCAECGEWLADVQ